jgi:predicted phage terminase large subunit-like protein
MSDAEGYTPLELEVAKAKCEAEHLFFTRFFFKARQNIKFRVNWHHDLVSDSIDELINGEIENLLINVSPGASKTELVVVNLMARGLALNPWSRFLHLSGSEVLALLNSATTRDIVVSDEFQAFWPMKIADDASAKKRWNVMVGDKAAGGVYATSMGGQVTGFRAGHMAEGFQGAIIIDDPLKPEEAFSKPKIAQANRKLVTTVKSRRANPKTPMVVIMQRVGPDDPSDFILKGGVGGKWKHVVIPALLDKAYVKRLAPRYRDLITEEGSIPRDKDGRRSYWEYKEPLTELLKMEKGEGIDPTGKRLSKFVFASQYDQRPKILGGNLLKGEHFQRYDEKALPKIKWRKIFADTAQKTAERNDYSVFGEFGLGIDGRLYLLDLIRDKWEAPELQRRAVAFWNKAKARDVEKYGQLRKMVVEDKSSGTGLIQTLKLPPYNIPIEPIERHKDKLTRVMDVQAYHDAGLCCIPEQAAFTSDFVAECEAFTADDTHDFDDQVDVYVDAIIDMLEAGNKLKQWEALGQKGR